MYRVIFHIDEEEKWPLLLGNVKNLLVDNEAVETEVLANASAVHAYQSKKYITQMAELSERGVQFVACQNALNAQHILKEDLPKFVSIVPAGITELVKKQNSGFAYIKP